jgi:predicted nuclease with TOPRIM domain
MQQLFGHTVGEYEQSPSAVKLEALAVENTRLHASVQQLLEDKSSLEQDYQHVCQHLELLKAQIQTLTINIYHTRNNAPHVPPGGFY